MTLYFSVYVAMGRQPILTTSLIYVAFSLLTGFKSNVFRWASLFMLPFYPQLAEKGNIFQRFSQFTLPFPRRSHAKSLFSPSGMTSHHAAVMPIHSFLFRHDLTPRRSHANSLFFPSGMTSSHATVMPNHSFFLPA